MHNRTSNHPHLAVSVQGHVIRAEVKKEDRKKEKPYHDHLASAKRAELPERLQHIPTDMADPLDAQPHERLL